MKTTLENMIQGEFAFVKQVDYQAYMSAKVDDIKRQYKNHMNNGGAGFLRNDWVNHYIENHLDEFRRQNEGKYRQNTTDDRRVFYFPRE